MKKIPLIAIILLIVGGLNWGLIGFFGFDIVATIFGSMSLFSRLVYSLVGISSLVVAFNANKIIK